MIKVIKEECTACGACADVCPQDAIVIEDFAVIDNDACVECGACIDECPQDAIVEE
jgi:ferredoxin